MTPEEVVALLEGSGAILKGHFHLSSGRHSETYVEKFRALEHPEVTAALGAELATRFEGEGFDVVLAPAMGAIVLGFATALARSKTGPCRSIFAERFEGELVLRRGFEIGERERALVVEDVVTTGKSLREVVSLVPTGQLAGIGCLLDRSEGTAAWPKPLVSLASMDIPSWEPAECPMCASGSEPVSPGSRHI